MKVIEKCRFNEVFRMSRISALAGLVLTVAACSPHYVMEVPSAPEEERAMKPYATAVWVDGDWEWRKDHHEFKKGYYNPPHRNSSYVPGEWKHTAKGYRYIHGRWKKNPS